MLRYEHGIFGKTTSMLMRIFSLREVSTNSSGSTFYKRRGKSDKKNENTPTKRQHNLAVNDTRNMGHVHTGLREELPRYREREKYIGGRVGKHKKETRRIQKGPDLCG